MKSNFPKKSASSILAFALVTVAQSTWACTVCFKGDADSVENVALRNGIFVLLGALVVVQIFLIKFFISFYKRSKKGVS